MLWSEVAGLSTARCALTNKGFNCPRIRMAFTSDRVQTLDLQYPFTSRGEQLKNITIMTRHWNKSEEPVSEVIDNFPLNGHSIPVKPPEKDQAHNRFCLSIDKGFTITSAIRPDLFAPSNKMNQFQLSNTLTERLRSLQQQHSTATFSSEHQEQINAFMGFNNNDGEQKSFMAYQAPEEAYDGSIQHESQGDIAPLPFNAGQFSGLSANNGIDRQALDELYKTLSNGDHQLDTSNSTKNNGSFVAMSNVNFGGNNRTTTPGMYSIPNQGGFTLSTQFQNQLNQHQNNMRQPHQGNIVFPSFVADGASASQLSSEALMSSLYSTNLNVLNHLQMKNNNMTPAMVPQPAPAEPVQKPVKALSAYNFFFRDQRDRILNGAEEDYSAEKQEKLLAGHWFRDRSQKRRHRKTHGKIAFTDLSRMVSKKWKELPLDKKAFYKQTAAKDLERYRREVHEMETKEVPSSQAPSMVIARTA